MGDQKIKCRFVACNTANRGFQNKTLRGQDNSKDDVAYVSGMKSKQIYSINLRTKESNILSLYQREDLPVDLTFVDRKAEGTFVEKSVNEVKEVKKTIFLTATYRIRS